MNLLEKIFRSRFKDKASLQGVDKDDLWANISANLDGASVVDNRNRYRWSILALLLLAFGFLCYFSFDRLIKSQDLQADDLPSEVAMSEIASEILETEAVKLTDTNITTQTDYEVATENNSDKKEILKKGFSLQENPSKKSNKKLNKNSVNTDFTNNNHKTQSITNSISANTETDQDKTDYPYVTTLRENIDKTAATKNIEKSNDNQTDQIAKTELAKLKNTTPFAPLSLATTETPFIYFEEKIGSPIIPKKHKKRSFEIGVQLGLNSLILNYKETNNNADLAKDLTQSTSGNLGYSAQVQITYLFRNKYSLSSGIQYNNLQTIFDRTSESSTTTLDQNLHLRNAIATRKVLHHNHYNMIAIPLEIGTYTSLGRFDIGAKLGVSYNFILSQKGKTIDSEYSIVEFDTNSSTAVPYRKSFFAYQMGLYADAKIGSRFKIRLSPTFKYMPLGASPLHGVQQDVMKIGITGGLIYRL